MAESSPVDRLPSPELQLLLPSSTSSPASSGKSSPRSRKSNLSLDLSSVPPLIKPTPPTNTLLITNLNNPTIFTPEHLQNLRDLINQDAQIYSWAPLKSFRRIVTSFETEEDAIRVRQTLDGEAIMGERIRVYYGQHTPINPVDQHLQAPESKKLFFISPPPSPPHGWEVRNEEPPNQMFLAHDLAEALHKLAWNKANSGSGGAAGSDMPETPVDDNNECGGGRKRSGSSTVLFEPEVDSKHEMPGIVVDDFSDHDSSPVSGGPSPGLRGRERVKMPFQHTSRPPVETMHDA